MNLSEETKQVYVETAKVLKGGERRLFMARILNMAQLEGRFERHPVLGRWFVRIAPLWIIFLDDDLIYVPSKPHWTIAEH